MTDEEEQDYVLGTHNDEIARLGLQHNVWRPHAHAVWQAAGFSIGQTILDVGCGPGYAAVDLAELVGPAGQVVAVDRSRRFLESLEARRETRGLENIIVVESDLDEVTFDAKIADGAWCRWVLAFVQRPRELLTRVARALRPGAAFVSHEYFDYALWRTLPQSPLLDEFVGATIDNWRKSGGEPDIGAQVPMWLEELGFEIESVRPLVYVISSRDYMWLWPTSFMEVGLDRLVQLGAIEPGRAPALQKAMNEITNSTDLRMITPGLLEVVARAP